MDSHRPVAEPPSNGAKPKTQFRPPTGAIPLFGQSLSHAFVSNFQRFSHSNNPPPDQASSRIDEALKVKKATGGHIAVHREQQQQHQRHQHRQHQQKPNPPTKTTPLLIHSRPLPPPPEDEESFDKPPFSLPPKLLKQETPLELASKPGVLEEQTSLELPPRTDHGRLIQNAAGRPPAPTPATDNLAPPRLAHATETLTVVPEETASGSESETENFYENNKDALQAMPPPLPPRQLVESQPWDHGDISRAEAERRLKQSQTNGTFLLRKAAQPSISGDKNSSNSQQAYTLSVLANHSADRVSHMKICRNEAGKLCLLADDGKSADDGSVQYRWFDSLDHLVQFYSRMRLTVSNGEKLTLEVACEK